MKKNNQKKLKKLTPKSCGHNTVPLHHFQRFTIMLESADTIVYPHTHHCIPHWYKNNQKSSKLGWGNVLSEILGYAMFAFFSVIQWNNKTTNEGQLIRSARRQVKTMPLTICNGLYIKSPWSEKKDQAWWINIPAQ